MYLDGSVVKVARAHGQAHGNSLELPLCKFKARTKVVTVVDLDGMAFRFEGFLQFVHLLQDPGLFLFSLEYRNHHDLDRCKLRRQHETVVVSVGHDEGTHQTGGNTP